MPLKFLRKHGRKRVYLTVAIALAALWGGTLLLARDCGGQPTLDRQRITVGDTPLLVEVADEPAELAAGLSDRCSLATGEGMLFLFPEDAASSFWMKQMHFPLDIVWINDGAVVQIDRDVPAPEPGEYPAIVYPRQPTDSVLEVPAGYAAAQGWAIGTPFRLRP
jgi:uncharacterized membrane protein (UPF0127 family)